MTSRSKQFGLAAIAGATLVLIALTWFGTFSAVGNQRAEAGARAEIRVASRAAVFAGQVRVSLLEVDEELRTLAHAWQSERDQFRLQAWRGQLVLLNEISPDLFIADEQGRVTDSTAADAVGSEIGDSDFFRAVGKIDNADMFIGPSTTDRLVRSWHMNLARPLRRADGAFAGVIVAALRLDAFGGFYDMANIGSQGLVAIVGMQDGRLRLALGPRPTEPETSIADSAMFAAMRAAPGAVWVGRSAPDGVARVHGFHPVAGRGLGVIVAMDRAEEMRATETWARDAYLFAGGITTLLLLLASLLIYATRLARRREAALARERTVLAVANAELAAAKAGADAKNSQLQATLAGMSDGVAMVDGNMQLVEWNEHFPAIASVPSDLLRVGLPIEEILRAQAATGVFGAVDVEAEVTRRMEMLRSGQYAAVMERTGPDGRVVELRRNRLPDGGFVTLYCDITAHRESVNALRQANALAEAASKAMSHFVAIVSHEIRTPLNALLNSLRLLADSEIAGADRVLVDTSQRAGEALSALINDILEMSRMEAGQLTLRPSIFALRPLIESVIAMFTSQATERRIGLRLSFAPGVPAELYEDPGRLRQVLINLISNAVKFAAPGEVRVIAEALPAAAAPRLRLAVRDRGPVIREDCRPRLFEPFSRLEDGSGTATIGTGLGLAICRHLVALMGGEIGCRTWRVGDCDAGNEFWLTLPIRVMPGYAAPSSSQVGAPPRRWLPRTRILLVEDILASQMITATLLRRAGHLVDVANNGAEAISAAATRPYDIVLMDNFMPVMSGVEAARRIRALGGPAASMPILALTANICPEDQAACAAAGMNAMLCKPVAPGELLDAIARHVWPHRSDHLPGEPDERAAEPTAPPVLSQARLEELRTTLSTDTLASLVEDCLADQSERVRSLREAISRQDTAQIHACAHAMAGMSAEYGMASLEARLRSLIQVARQEPGVALGERIDAIEAELSRTGTMLRAAFRTEPV